MSTSWKSQQSKGRYALQFETDDKEKYKLVEKAAQMAMDGEIKPEGEFQTMINEMIKIIGEENLDKYTYRGKTLREWASVSKTIDKIVEHLEKGEIYDSRKI
jgi:hypothetical protein